jgi:hypothetical protein
VQLSERKKTYYAQVHLWSNVSQGLPSGSGWQLKTVPVVVCIKCGQAEFTVLEQDLRHINR